MWALLNSDEDAIVEIISNPKNKNYTLENQKRKGKNLEENPSGN